MVEIVEGVEGTRRVFENCESVELGEWRGATDSRQRHVALHSTQSTRHSQLDCSQTALESTHLLIIIDIKNETIVHFIASHSYFMKL